MKLKPTHFDAKQWLDEGNKPDVMLVDDYTGDKKYKAPQFINDVSALRIPIVVTAGKRDVNTQLKKMPHVKAAIEKNGLHALVNMPVNQREVQDFQSDIQGAMYSGRVK